MALALPCSAPPSLTVKLQIWGNGQKQNMSPWPVGVSETGENALINPGKFGVPGTFRQNPNDECLKRDTKTLLDDQGSSTNAETLRTGFDCPWGCGRNNSQEYWMVNLGNEEWHYLSSAKGTRRYPG